MNHQDDRTRLKTIREAIANGNPSPDDAAWLLALADRLGNGIQDLGSRVMTETNWGAVVCIFCGCEMGEDHAPTCDYQLVVDLFQRRCSVCGCTDDEACIEGCSWVGPELCSACEGE